MAASVGTKIVFLTTNANDLRTLKSTFSGLSGSSSSGLCHGDINKRRIKQLHEQFMPEHSTSEAKSFAEEIHMDNPVYTNQEDTAAAEDSQISNHADVQMNCDKEILKTDYINSQTVLDTSLKSCQPSNLHHEKSVCSTESFANIEVGHQSSQADLESDDEKAHDSQNKQFFDKSESETVIQLRGNMQNEPISVTQIINENERIVTTGTQDDGKVLLDLSKNNQDNGVNPQVDIPGCQDGTSQYVEQDQISQSDCNQFQQAEEIVKKLCKNGKVMQFHEGDDFIKVIVYEDSAEGDEAEETESAEEFEINNEREQVPVDNNMATEHDGSRNLLDCLIENEKGKRHIEPDFSCDEGSDLFKRPRTVLTSDQHTFDVIADSGQPRSKQNTQWCQDTPIPLDVASHTMTEASAIQSNFNQTVNKFGTSFMTCNVADLEPVDSIHSNHTADGQNEPRMYTPNPKNGYMYYVSEDTGAVEGLYRASPLTESSSERANLPQTTPRDKRCVTSQTMIHLNSSGEENVSPSDMMDTPSGSQSQQRQMQKKIRSLIQMPEYQTDELGKLREQHNQKERKRRSRIKEACNLLRQLVPGMSDKTDKATVFEFAARYVHFLKSHTGSQFDTDFLMKYSPY